MTADLKFAPTMPAKRAKSHGFLPPAKPFTVRDSNQEAKAASRTTWRSRWSRSLILLGRYKKRRLWLNVDCRFCPGDDGDLLLRDQGIGTPAETNLHIGLVLAKLFGAHLTLLHVYQDPSYAVEYVLGPHGYDRSLKERIYFEKTLKTTVEGLRKEYADCDSEFRDGAPCEEIVNTAKERDIDLIIISTHHYNWLTRLACGSDAEHILRNMPCPILIFQANATPGTSMLP